MYILAGLDYISAINELEKAYGMLVFVIFAMIGLAFLASCHRKLIQELPG